MANLSRLGRSLAVEPAAVELAAVGLAAVDLVDAVEHVVGLGAEVVAVLAAALDVDLDGVDPAGVAGALLKVSSMLKER